MVCGVCVCVCVTVCSVGYVMPFPWYAVSLKVRTYASVPVVMVTVCDHDSVYTILVQSSAIYCVFQSLCSSSDSGSGSQEKHYSVPRNLPALQPHSDLSFKDASGHHPSGKHNIDIRSNTDGHF